MGGFLVGIGESDWSFGICFAGTFGGTQNSGKVCFTSVGVSSVCFGVANGTVEIRADNLWLFACVHRGEGGAWVLGRNNNAFWLGST